MNNHAAPVAPNEPSSEFVLPNYNAVTEDNWQEQLALGVRVLSASIPDEDLHEMMWAWQSLYGTQNVLTGDAFDRKEQRPLHLKPGHGIYVRPEGEEYHQALLRKSRERRERDADH